MSGVAQDEILTEIRALREQHQKMLLELHDPSMKLYHERNGGLVETTEPFLHLCQSTVDRLDALLANVEAP